MLNKDILEILKQLKLDNNLMKEIGKLYSVTRTAISDIINRKTWKHTK